MHNTQSNSNRNYNAADAKWRKITSSWWWKATIGENRSSPDTNQRMRVPMH